jgi:aspartate carbamoyltransferase catalytic subunit
MPQDLQELLSGAGVAQQSFSDLPSALADTDVLYVTRVQKERFADAAEYERLKLAFVVTADTMRAAKPRMIVMHPLPRVGEIAEEVDADPRAAYFRQMRVGLYVRMALLALVCGVTREQVAEAAAAAAAR